MSGKIIATIYFYLISAVSLFLIVLGIFATVTFIINMTQYEKYPLRYPQMDCELGYGYSNPMPVRDFVETTPSAQEIEKQTQACIRQQDEERKQHKVEDIKDAITFSLVGIILFAIHFPLARKQLKG